LDNLLLPTEVGWKTPGIISEQKSPVFNRSSIAYSSLLEQALQY
jgi:hypothetical protein